MRQAGRRLYRLMSYTVSERVPEIGLRVAASRALRVDPTIALRKEV